MLPVGLSLCVLSLAFAASSGENARHSKVPSPEWKTAGAVVESTYDVWPQVQSIGGDGSRQVPLHPVPRRLSPRQGSQASAAAPSGGLGVPGGTIGATSGGSGFAGISLTPWTPPDLTLAVGPDHVVQTVNMVIAFYTKSGTLLFSQNLDSTGTPGFFEGVGGGDFCFDPKCLYDQHSGRFVVVALEEYGDTLEATIDIAVSDDSDPNGTWYKYRTDAVTDVGGSDYWVDYPGLGVDADAIYVSGNLFGFFGGFGGAKYRIFEKAPLLTGAAASYADLLDTSSYSVQVAHEFGTAAAPFFASEQNTTTIRLQAITDPLGSPALVTADVSVPAFTYPFTDVPNLDGCAIEALDGRLVNAAWRDGSLLTAHGVGSGSKNVARWYEFDTGSWPASGSPTLVQSGDIDAGGAFHTWFPAIMSNSSGEIGVVLARSSPAEYAGIYYTGRLPSDPPGTMSVPLTLIAVGTSGYCSYRWGDYFGIAVDPSDDSTFWGVGEYATDMSTWQSWISSFALDAAPVFGPGSPCDMTLPVKVGDTLTFTVSASDPDAGDTVTLSASGVPAGASHVPALPIFGAAPSTMFSWTPTLGAAGDHVLTYTASDGTRSSTCQVTVRVKSKVKRHKVP